MLVALLVVPAVGSTSATTKRGAQLDKVTIAAIALDPAGPVMYAKDRGFFRQQGIDAEIRIVADGTQTVPALLSGQAQFTGLLDPTTQGPRRVQGILGHKGNAFHLTFSLEQL